MVVWADGGGATTAARRAVVGRARVARYLTGVITKFGSGVRVSLAEVNGEPAVLGWSGLALLGVLVPEYSAVAPSLLPGGSRTSG